MRSTSFGALCGASEQQLYKKGTLRGCIGPRSPQLFAFHTCPNYTTSTRDVNVSPAPPAWRASSLTSGSSASRCSLPSVACATAMSKEHVSLHAWLRANAHANRRSGAGDAVIHPSGGLLTNRQRPQLQRVDRRVSRDHPSLTDVLVFSVSADGLALSSTATAVIASRADGLSSAAHSCAFLARSSRQPRSTQP